MQTVSFPRSTARPHAARCSPPLTRIAFRNLEVAVVAGCLLVAVALGRAPAAASTGVFETEPNNTCATANNLGPVVVPFSVRGSLDTPQRRRPRYSCP